MQQDHETMFFIGSNRFLYINRVLVLSGVEGKKRLVETNRQVSRTLVYL
jgi:hypothetical protein